MIKNLLEEKLKFPGSVTVSATLPAFQQIKCPVFELAVGLLL